MPLAASEIPAAPVVILMALGVIVAIVGHTSRSRTLIVAGLMILFMATAAMVAGAYVAYNDDPSDPREERDPREPGF